jgi:hypothetical protein
MSATTSFPDADKEKQNVDVHDQPVGSSLSPDPGSEKPRLSKESDTVVEGSAAEPQDAGQYATGAKLLIIVLALVLSVFLFSLDQVCFHHN